jgi:hypothetical protein
VAEQTFTVVVNPMTASLTLTPGPDYVYVALKTGNKISVLGGTSTRKFTVTGGALPPGVVLSATSGALSGTPSKAGTFLVTFHVADSVGNSATLSTSILITGMTFTTYAKSSAKVGVSYSSTVKVSGGKATIVYSATGLPPGLKISAAGAISGTPTTAGSYQVSVTATDHGTPVNTATASMPITVTG